MTRQGKVRQDKVEKTQDGQLTDLRHTSESQLKKARKKERKKRKNNRKKRRKNDRKEERKRQTTNKESE